MKSCPPSRRVRLHKPDAGAAAEEGRHQYRHGREARENAKALDNAVNDIGQITGQKAVITRAKKSIAAFKLRTGMPIGVMVTLRGDRMYDFLDRLFNVALARVRDFSGVSPKSFDGHGNYSLGLREQLIFPEIEYDQIDKIRGMEIVIVTSAKNDEEGRRLLRDCWACRSEAQGSGYRNKEKNG